MLVVEDELFAGAAVHELGVTVAVLHAASRDKYKRAQRLDLGSDYVQHGGT